MTKNVIEAGYSPLEEKLNIYSHGLGFVLSVIGTFFLIIKAINQPSPLILGSVLVFGFSLCILYAASTIYHSRVDINQRRKMRIVDHACIYILIAGSYTPFTLVTLSSSVGWIIFIVIWTMAILGIIFKLFFTGRFELFSTGLYVLMGWMVIFAYQPLVDSISPQGLYWLLTGGIAYSMGAILYSIQKIPFNHAIFHVFVLIGSACHFMAVYQCLFID